MLAWQALINPGLEMPGVERQATTSHKLYGNGPIITTDMLKGFMSAYFRTDAEKIESSPLLASDLRDLPRAFVAVGQCDPLRDECVAYADRLAAAGVQVQARVYRGVPHNFMTMTHVSDVPSSFLQDLISDACSALHEG